MSRRTTREDALQAAQEASEAARKLQARGQEVKAERAEPAPEPKAEETTNLTPPAQKVKRGNPDREAMLDEIRQKRGEPKEEPEEKEPEEVKEPPVEAKEPPKEEVKAETPPVVETPPEVVPEAPKTVRVKVDGQEFDAPAEEVEAHGGVRGYQIAKAQDNRLKKTNEALALAQRLLAAQPKAPTVPQKSDVDFIAEKMDVVRFGTPAEAASAWIEIQQRSNKPVDQNALISRAVSAMNQNQAVAEFGKSFPEITSNPLLLKLAITMEAEEVQSAEKEGRSVDYRNLYNTIGTKIRSVVPPRQSQPQTAPKQESNPSSLAEKEARKASNVTVIPTAAARAEHPKEEAPETREESLNRMRKARGQQQL